MLSQETFLHPNSSPFSSSSASASAGGQLHVGNRHFGPSQGEHRHPSVPLSLSDFSVLDELAETIVKLEAHRVFADSGLSVIHGTTIKTADQAKMFRDQINCWTRFGSWVRQDESTNNPVSVSASEAEAWITRKHLGDPMFAKCDTRFMEGLNKVADEGYGDYFFGEYDKRQTRWIVREAVKYRWVPDESICGPTSQQQQQQQQEIPPKDKDETEDTTTSTDTLVGLGDDRSIYLPFNTQDFCDTIGNRNIMLAGDVTQYQLHDSILSAVGTPFTCHGDLGCLHDIEPHHPLCVGATNANLTYARNDIISVPWAVDPQDEDYPSSYMIEQDWGNDDRLLRYKIVLLNKGLVWQTDTEFLTDLVFTMKKLWKYHPDIMILYRATHPVSNCTILKEQGEDEAIAAKDGVSSLVSGMTLQKPLTEPPKRRRKDHTGAKTRPTLADIQRQNKIAKAIVESAGGIFLDTEAMFALRPDGRMGDGDCSRFCAPGPLDVYADLIYNTLRILPRDIVSENTLTIVDHTF
ncbi:hypothetical protein BGZ76_010371 [Entomortierella beljakovae]|nr:hypothetical protein BGZ76_010371 [Entomortierella beljakovae]